MNDDPGAIAEVLRQNLPTSPDDLLAYLARLGIDSQTLDHAPVYTVAEAQAKGVELPGAHIKNLFLRNRKEEMWLVVADQNRKVDLKELGERLGAGKLSFGSPERLMAYLGVLPGSVTPFSVINDKETRVKVVFEDSLRRSERINAHPLVNYKTTNLAFEDLLKFLASTGHNPEFVRFEKIEQTS